MRIKEYLIKKVPASEFSLDDDFLKHEPQTEKEQAFKEQLETAIKNGINDFWCIVCDPSFDENDRIYYEPGNMPAVGKSFYWWYKNATEFWPERGSRLGTKTEYIAFLAMLIKELVTSGKSIEWAWSAVCNDSKELGHYNNSTDAKISLEPTGSREICGWYDLANCYKILAEDEKAPGLWGFWLAGGYLDSRFSPLTDLYHDLYRCNNHSRSCGWLVLTK